MLVRIPLVLGARPVIDSQVVLVMAEKLNSLN